MWPMVAMTALSGGMSLMSGIGARNSSAKQGRLQMMEDARMDALNQERLAVMNRQREALGREMLTVEEKTTVQDNSWQSTNTATDLDIDAFMAAGEKAGFNPVTWLNSGALSMFARGSSLTMNGGEVTTTRQGHNAADAFKLMAPDAYYGTPTQIPKVPDMLEVFGNAGTAALGTFKDLYKMQSSQDFQSSLLDRQLTAMAQRQLGGGTTIGGASYGTSMSSGGRAGAGGGLSSGSKVSSTAYPASWERGDVNVTNPHNRWRVDTTSGDAEAGEARYGEIGGEILGMSNVINDAVLNSTGKTLREWGRETGMNIGDYPSLKDWYAAKFGAPVTSTNKAPLTITVRPARPN